MSRISLFVAFMAVCAWICVPGVVAFTLQNFAIFLCLLVLGGAHGLCSIVVYLLLGLCGLPVFAGFCGGPGVLMGATGGYLIGFLCCGLVYWAFTPVLRKYPWLAVIALLIGLVLCYTTGTLWYLWVYLRQSGLGGLSAALGCCVLPYLLPDLIKLVLAVVTAGRLKHFLSRSPR